MSTRVKIAEKAANTDKLTNRERHRLRVSKLERKRHMFLSFQFVYDY